MKKSAKQRGPDGRLRKFGRKEPQSVWCTKLRCSCGSSFRRFLWHKNADGSKIYGYECYRQKRQVSKNFLKAHGLDPAQVCHTKSIPFWHIDFMALRVFQTVWKDQKEAILMACKMLEECSVQEQQQSSALLESLQNQLDRLHTKLEGLRGMCAMGDITREEFLHDKQSIQSEIEHLHARIEDVSALSLSPVPTLDMAQIKRTLDSWLDFSGPRISEELIEEFILQVVLINDNTFNWTLDLSSHEVGVRHLHPSEIALLQYRERQSSNMDTILDRRITDPQPLFTITITKEDARAYCRSIGMKFFEKKWQDKTVIISI